MTIYAHICEETYHLQNVEILDWRRLDLDPVSLTRVGKCLRELHLQWSGKNTTLRAWSEKEGLAMIPTLETISVTQVEVFKSTLLKTQPLTNMRFRIEL